MWYIAGISEWSNSIDSEKMNYLLKFICSSIGQIYSSLRIFLPSLNLLNQICYVYSLCKKKKKMNSASLNSQHFAIFLSTRKSKSSLYHSSPCDCSIVCTSFPIPSNKSIDLPTSWQWSSSNSALALNTNKKFSKSSPKRRFNQISPFPWAKSAPQNSI